MEPGKRTDEFIQKIQIFLNNWACNMVEIDKNLIKGVKEELLKDITKMLEERGEQYGKMPRTSEMGAYPTPFHLTAHLPRI